MLNYLKVYKNTEELLYKLYPRLINYPKAEKFALCSEINSWLGHARKGDCHNMINSIVSQTETFYYNNNKISVKGR